jgi:O-antigen ligase
LEYSRLLPRRGHWRLWLIQGLILLTFALIPVWYRYKFSFHDFYVTRFLIFLPALGTVLCWLSFGLPGFAALRRDTLKALWALLLLTLAFWALASPEWAFTRESHPEVAGNAALQLSVSILFALVVACAGPPPRALITVLVIGVFWNALLTILQAANQGHLGLSVLGEFKFTHQWPGISVVEAGDLRWIRPYGLLPHPNLLAGFFAAALPASFAWILEQSWRRWAGLLIFVLGFYALMLTFSRAAWIGFAVGMMAVLPLVWRFYLKKGQARLQLAAAFGLALMVGVVFVVMYRPLLIARTGVTAENTELRSVNDRLVFASFAYRAIDDVPFVGVGVGNFPWRASYFLQETDFDLRGDNVHQVMLSVWAELGVVGFGLTIAALILGFEAVLRGLHASTDKHAIFLLAGVIALTIIGLFDHYPWTLLHFQIAWWGLMAGAMRRVAL